MKNDSSRSIPSQVIVGALVLALGLAFLLDNLDIIDFNQAVSFWPVAFIVLGAAKLLDTNSPGGLVNGCVLIGIGVVLMLHRLGYLYFGWSTIWPLILIMLGGALIYRAVAGRRAIGGAMVATDGSDSVVDITAILGGFERRVTSQDFRGGEITAVMGGCELDMRGSSINGEAVINVFAAMGGISIKVPPDWTVVLHGTPILGGFEEKTLAPPNNAKRLIIKGYAIMGGVEVRN
ncbi:MAG: hypothetical protein H7176_03540 [Bdellovibrionales bacterium]|nr:hypothetical protein [Massilia sp.]